MANEITIQSKLTATKGGSSVTNYTSDFTINMGSTLTKMTSLVQSVGTREALLVGDVDVTKGGAPGATDTYWVHLVNNDATNYVTVEVQTGASSYWPIGILHPGEPFGPIKMLQTDGSGYGGLFLTASASTCDVNVTVSEAGDPS